MPTRLVLADNHALVRQGLRALLEREGLDVVGEAADGREAVRLAQELRPDVALLDIGMPLLNGIDAAREIQRGSRTIRTILLTRHHEDQYVTEALRAGVRGYVLKNQAATELVEAIRKVCRNEVSLSSSLSRAAVKSFLSRQELPDEPLTARERQVLQLVGEGKSTKDVAAILGIAVKTADSHRSRLMDKLDIHETASLVRYAIRRGLVQP